MPAGPSSSATSSRSRRRGTTRVVFCPNRAWNAPKVDPVVLGRLASKLRQLHVEDARFVDGLKDDARRVAALRLFASRPSGALRRPPAEDVDRARAALAAARDRGAYYGGRASLEADRADRYVPSPPAPGSNRLERGLRRLSPSRPRRRPTRRDRGRAVARRRRKYPTRILHVRWENSDKARPARSRFEAFATSRLRVFGRVYELLTALPHEEQPKLLFFAVEGFDLEAVDIAAARGFLLPRFDGLAWRGRVAVDRRRGRARTKPPARARAGPSSSSGRS